MYGSIMSKELTERLTCGIRQAVRLDEIEEFTDKLAFYYQHGELAESEYADLRELHQKQLKIVLDLSLLPERSLIDAHVDSQAAAAIEKVDPAEISAAEFEVIEQEAIRLNGARLNHIQDHFFIHSGPVRLRKRVLPELHHLRTMLAGVPAFFRQKLLEAGLKGLLLAAKRLRSP